MPPDPPLPEPSPAPVLYLTDLTFDRFDPADLFDLAFLLRSARLRPVGVCLSETDGNGQRIANALEAAARTSIPVIGGTDGLRAFLESTTEAVNLMVTGGYGSVAELLAGHRPLIREKVARLFLVGGQVNDYSAGRAGERLPIDPRLKQRHPERFDASGDPRVTDPTSFSALLTSGEGIIWLPRDICLWRYAAPQLLADGGPLCELLLRETFFRHLTDAGFPADRYDAAEAPVLLSSLPGLLLATEPDPFAWMRLFRVIPGRVTERDSSVRLETVTDSPNLFVVVAIDGQALGKLLTAELRVRPPAV
ncbi:MAG: hypothetical protein SFU56_09765 [Capsulimonadales bacterium]|nr:hypothetical protein [Capsulimonadales bacterium]